HLLAAETSAVALLLSTSLVLRTPGLLLLVQSAREARARVAGVVAVAAGVVVGAALEVVEVVEVVAAVGVVAGVGALVAAVEAAVGVAVVAAVGVVEVGQEHSVEVLEEARGSDRSVGASPRRPSSFTCGKPHTQHRCFSRLDDAWRAEFGDEIERPHWAELLRSGVAIFDLDYDALLSAMYALSASTDGECYRCVPSDPGIEAAALGASESSLPSTTLAEALHTFTLDSGASRCFFRDSTTLTPLHALVPVRLADHSGGPVVARSSTVLPCLAVPSGSLAGLHLPSFSTNLVSIAALQDLMVTTTTRGGQCVSICTCPRMGRHLATLTRWPGSSLYTPATEPPQVAASAQVSLSGQVAPRCSCRLLSHQTLLWHHRLGHPSLPHLRGMHSCLLVSGLPRSLPPLPPSPAPPCLPCVEGRQRAAPHSSSFPSTTAPLTFLSSDCTLTEMVSSPPDLLRDFCCGEGITQSFTLPASPQQNGVAEHRIGLVMEVARTYMIHAVAPHFLWPFAVRYTAYQLNLWPRVSLPETSPTLRWTGEVGDASVFRSVPFYRLFPYRSAPPPPPLLFLAPGPPPVDPLPPQVPAPSGVSQVDPLPGTVPVEVAGNSGAPRGAASGGAEPGGAVAEGAGSRGAESGGAESGGAEPRGAEPGGSEPAGVEPGGAEPEGVEPGDAESEGAESGGAEPRGAASSGGHASALPGLSPRPKPLSLQQLCEWLVRRARLRSGAAGAGATGDTGAGGAGVTAGAGGTGGTAAAGPGGARTRGTRAAGTGGVGGAGAGDPTKPGAAGAGGSGAGGTVARGAGDGGAGAEGTGAGGVGAGGAGAIDLGARGAGTRVCPPPDQSQPPLLPASPLPAPSPYHAQFHSLIERCEPTSRPVSPVRTARHVPRSRPPPIPDTHAQALRPSSVPLRVPVPPPLESSLSAIPDPESDLVHAACPIVSHLLATAVTDHSFESTAASALVAELLDLAAACRLDYATALVAESESASPPSVGGECALGTDVLEDRQEDFECLAAAVPCFASMLLAPEGDPDAPDIPTPCSMQRRLRVPWAHHLLRC
ncbi:unnamed protein product, partial [Closterium sp. NIES-53]